MPILTVGPTSTFASIAAAMAVAGTGDIILLETGYGNENAAVTVNGLSFDGGSTSTNVNLQLATGIGSLTLLGTAPINVIDGPDANAIVGNAGDNVIRVSSGVDVVTAGNGTDRLIIDYAAATASITGTLVGVTDGGTHAVTFTGVENLTITTGSGNDTLTVANGFNVLTTGSGDDTITAGNGPNIIDGGANNDTITAGSGVNTILGGGGNDTIIAGDGGNSVDGGSGDDGITTGAGNDVVIAGLGNDTIVTGGGADVTTVNGGIDTVDSGSQRDRLIVDFSSSTTNITGGVTGGTLAGGYDGAFADVAGTSSVVFLGTEDLTVTTGSGNDVIASGDGNDVLDGGAGSDQLNSGGGNDTLLIGLGNDALDGGAGTDAVIFSGARANYQVTNLGGGVIQTIDLRSGSPDGTDTLVNMEGFVFTDGTYDSTTVLIAPTATLTVGPNSTYPSIAAAMAAAGPGDTVVLESGYSNESATVTHAGMIMSGGATSTGIVLHLATGIATFSLAGAAPISVIDASDANAIVGNDGDNLIAASGGIDTVSGGIGNDRLLVDYSGVTTGVTGGVIGGSLQAGYSGHIADLAGNTVDFQTTENFTITTGSGNDNITTGDGVDVLHGGAGSDLLHGGGGDDIIDGGSGIDTLTGGTGNDWFFVDNAADVVNEATGGGTLDRVFASGSYALTAGSEIELLTTTDHTGTAAINLKGNELSNTIYGNDGDNIIDGGIGADNMAGRSGNDWFFVDNVGDVVNENLGEGALDRVFASLSYTLAPNSSVEMLTTTDHSGTASINLTGNALSQSIYGNAGDNVLRGGGGGDGLVGLGGNDWYFIDDSRDTVGEAIGGGTADRVFAAVSYNLTAGAEVEQMSTTDHAGTEAINLRGNEFANLIYGNAGTNILSGGGGIDTLYGGVTASNGNDYFLFETAPNGNNNYDFLPDYNPAQDEMLLLSSAFGGMPTGYLSAGAFSTTGAHDADDRVLYDASSGSLYFDADGSGSITAELFAVVRPGTALTANEFHII